MSTPPQSRKDLLNEMGRVREYGGVISRLLGSRVRLLCALSEEYYRLAEEPDLDSPNKSKEKIIRSFRNQIAELRADPRIMDGIEQAIDAKYDGLITCLKQGLGNSLKPEDYKIIAMVLSDIPRPVIRFFTKLSDDALRKRISRYREKFKALPAEYQTIILEKMTPVK